MAELRSLIVVLGDQLDLDAAAFDDFDAALDAVWMAEVAEESTHVWSSKPRIVMFLAAMRHFALALQAASRPLQYRRLDAPGSGGNLGNQLQADILRLKPARLVMYALMLGVQPKQVHAWYLAVYVDAVEWVELPNTLGMSQYADGGVMGSKPYIATGKYIQRMSPHCKGCRYDPAQRSGDTACPFTTLYWDFLIRHESTMARNPRMALQVKNVARLTDVQKQAVTERAASIRRGEVGSAHG